MLVIGTARVDKVICLLILALLRGKVRNVEIISDASAGPEPWALDA
jgi:hypothetical protein